MINAPRQTLSDLYFESHVTIEPVFEEDLQLIKVIAGHHSFRVADLLMKKRKEDSEERSQYDTFMTCRHKDFKVISSRTKDLVVQLKQQGFKVWRYKIEDTICDSNVEDSFLLGVEKPKSN